jgi:hypothetical protein
MKSKILAFVCLLSLAAFFVFCFAFFSVKSSPKPIPIKDSVVNVSSFVDTEEDATTPQHFDGDIQSEAYSFGFKRGKDAFLIQSENPSAPPSTTKEEYAVLFEDKYSDEEKNTYKESMLKGYIDGYHKTAETFYCPRTE